MLIRVSYHGPTNTRPSRWSTDADDSPRRSYSRECDRGPTDDAERAALRYAESALHYDRPRIAARGQFRGDHYFFVHEAGYASGELHPDATTAAAALVAAHPDWTADHIARAMIHATQAYVPTADCFAAALAAGATPPKK